uniref:Reverse transcriptase RNase H-like domain-containing protein n=1 Tax=Acrobeloides nanus TaxID=290746 RepID=A0A914DEX0_9BILA
MFAYLDDLIIASEDEDEHLRDIEAFLKNDEEGHEHPIAFASRALIKHEQRYPSVEMEALAIVFGVKQYQPYIEVPKNEPVEVQLVSSAVTIKPISVVAKEVIDNRDLCTTATSKVNAITTKMAQGQEVITLDAAGAKLDNLTLEDVREAQKKTSEIKQIYDALKQGQWRADRAEKRKLEKIIHKYVIRYSAVYFKPSDDEADLDLRLLIPYVYREPILQMYHESPASGSHCGDDKLTEL